MRISHLSLLHLVELRGVRFAYPTRQTATVFDGLNLAIPAGQTAALVGSGPWVLDGTHKPLFFFGSNRAEGPWGPTSWWEEGDGSVALQLCVFRLALGGAAAGGAYAAPAIPARFAAVQSRGAARPPVSSPPGAALPSPSPSGAIKRERPASAALEGRRLCRT